jgi:small subunit ribosomal protein S20
MIFSENRHPLCPIIALAGRHKKFNLISGLSAFPGPVGGFRSGRKALTLLAAPSIRPAMAAGAIPPPLFFERRRDVSIFAPAMASLENTWKYTSVDQLVERPARSSPTNHDRSTPKEFENMANTTSAKKATRKIARRTIINKSRRTQMRGAVRTVEEAIKSGDRDAALKAFASAEPELMQAAQRNIIHKNNASRKVSRLAHQIAKLAK